MKHKKRLILSAIAGLAVLMMFAFQNCAESLDLSEVDNGSNGDNTDLTFLSPVITQSDIEKTFDPNTTMVLNVEAQGEGTLQYQWFRVENSLKIAIAGATSKTLTIPNVTTAHTGNYIIEVSNSYGTDRRTIKVTVGSTTNLKPPVIVTQLQDVNATAVKFLFGQLKYNTGNGDTVTFTVSANGTNLVYQWYKVGDGGALKLIPGAVSPKYSFQLTSLSQSGAYVVFVINADGAVQSSAKLKIQVLQ